MTWLWAPISNLPEKPRVDIATRYQPRRTQRYSLMVLPVPQGEPTRTGDPEIVFIQED